MPARYAPLLQYLHRLASPRVASTAPDAELLHRFARQHDEAAFAALVARHGPMVLAVCRRVLQTQDADDAFQATFLVLMRKAATLRQPELLANWLYGAEMHDPTTMYKVFRREAVAGLRFRRNRFAEAPES